jgi:diguanylate cyclase (GGDEF)-like protein/PAS domain S-box-containing protein
MNSPQIMVVEDERVVAADLEMRLRRLGYRVPAVVSSGEEALCRAAETNPDLVLMDIMLAGQLDGMETAARIKDGLDIPVIYLTAHGDAGTLQRAKSLEPFGYILKPFDERNLHAAVEVALFRAQMERKLKQREQWLAATLQGIGEAVIAIDSKGNIAFMNGVAQAMTGYRQEEATGRSLPEVVRIIHEETRQSMESAALKTLRDGVVVRQEDRTVLVAKDGREIPVAETASPIKDSKGHVTDVVLIFRDMSERRRTEAMLRSLSLTDELTGLKNRRGFLAAAEQNFKLAVRRDMGLFMCFIDLDGLKQINDSLGHERGDQAIITTAEILRAGFRAHDILARWGGDEFAVLALDVTNSCSEESFAARLRETLEYFNAKAGSSVQLSFSVGVVRCDLNQIYSLNELINLADEKMYAQKREIKTIHALKGEHEGSAENPLEMSATKQR